MSGVSDTSASVSLARGTSPTKLSIFARPAVGTDGTFAQRFSIKRGKRAQVLYVQATASAPQRDLAATACKAAFGVPCLGATASGFVDVSATRKIVVPAAPPPKKKK